MQTARLAVAVVLLTLASATPAWADAAPPEIPCTAADRQSYNRDCVECQPGNCTVSEADGYRYECTSDESDFTVWCETVTGDEGGCSAVSTRRGPSWTAQIILALLLGVFGFVLYHRSRPQK